jgi:hypothetical protein
MEGIGNTGTDRRGRYPGGDARYLERERNVDVSVSVGRKSRAEAQTMVDGSAAPDRLPKSASHRVRADGARRIYRTDAEVDASLQMVGAFQVHRLDPPGDERWRAVAGARNGPERATARLERIARPNAEAKFITGVASR